MSNSESTDSDKGDDKPPGGDRKIQRSVESMLKQMEMSDEEIKYRMDNFDNVEIGKEYKKYLKCTKCNKNFQNIINKGEKVGVHPLLGVLMCDSCCDYYGDGYFSLDSEGEDKYCRWCGEGGTIFACAKCICGFCDACIEKHFGATALEAVKNDDDWVCYFCNPKPLWYLRSICFLAKEAAKNKKELLKKKERENTKRKRRKIEILDDDLNYTSSDDSKSSSSSSNKFSKKRKRRFRHKENIGRCIDESSSSEDEKENHLDSKKKLRKSKTPSMDKRKLSDGDSKYSVKNSEFSCDNNDFGNKRTLVLEKLKSIWKLTETISEVGLNSSRERLKTLSKSHNFKTLDLLKREHEKLKSCMNILVSSLNSASNSADSIKEDLTFDTTKDEREIFQSEETKLKRFAEKCQVGAHIQSSTDSEEGSSQKEFEMEKCKEKRLAKRKENSMRDSEKVKNKRLERDVSSDEESVEGKKKSVSVCRESDSVGKKKKQSADKYGKNYGSGKQSCGAKPLLKVKSFARMLDENVYDKKKKVGTLNVNPVVIDLYNIDTDEGEDDKKRVKQSSKDKADDVNAKAPDSEDKMSKKNDGITQATRADDREVEKASSDKREECTNSFENKNESERTKSSETESGEENTNVDAVKCEKNNSPLNLNNEKTELSDEENEKECTDEGKNVREDKSSQTCKKNKKSDQDENEKSSIKSEETEEKNENKRQASQNGDTDNEKASEHEERMSCDEKTSNEEKKRDCSEEDEKISSEEEPKSIRKTRGHKKEKRKLVASFEKYKRQRERFLNSKEKLQLQGVKSENAEAVNALESSESESDRKDSEQKKPKRKRILASSEEENSRETKDCDAEKLEEDQKSDSEESVSSGEVSSDDEGRKKKTSSVTKRKITEISDSSEDDLNTKRKTQVNSSESSEDEEKKKKRGRKNIKKILKKDSLQVETKEALKNEEERKKRLKERQKLFEELFEKDKKDGSPRQIILDFDPETKEPLVVVHKKLAKKLKPHQVEGVKFMWDNCFESVQKLEEESGSGCILAHCMGLGKTFQVVTLVHTVMTHDLGVNTVLIVCPLSTVSNWIREFEMWLGNIHTDPITLYDLVKYKKVEERKFHLEDWHKNGGVLFLSYDLFRNLTKEIVTKKGKKKKSRYQQAFEKALLDPGPDLVICDEGHLLKNEDTALSKSVSRIKTARRIVLTGTPLQNNLIEYHCMVQFVKPNILGTRKEFSNRFVNPISNGQFEDSTDLDVKIMKRRSHVLHSMLEGCIQRFDYSVLTPFLPEKHEFVLLISLTDTQARAYLHFIKTLSAKSSGSSKAASLFNDYHNLQRIWTHPRALLMQSERETQKETMEDDSEGSLKDFVVSSDEEVSESGSESSGSSTQEVVSRKRILRSNANDPEVKESVEESEKPQEKFWWEEFYDEKAYDDIRESNKLLVLFSLLKYCEEAKDKVLVFSQSLYTLDLIEFFLNKVDENNKKNNEQLDGHQGSWVLGTDYFRMDGSTKSESRAIWCKYFNEESNTRARLFLISTKAGGLGINLYGANRVVLFDASWNPSYNLQSIFRVYRFGQKKTCYIYRFLSEATMEEKIYERQVTKLSLAHRVVDEHQIERHYTMGNLQELYNFEPTPKDQRKVPKLPKDSVLADLLADHKDIIVSYHEHDSLLENKQEEELSEEERKAAWKEYEEERVQKTLNFDAAVQQQMMLAQQMQFPAGGMTVNPAYFSQANAGSNFLNSMFIHPNIPFEALRRGMQVGVTPLPEESLESYFTRIFNRESWMMIGQHGQ